VRRSCSCARRCGPWGRSVAHPDQEGKR
jgi:hypothetical protein